MRLFICEASRLERKQLCPTSYFPPPESGWVYVGHDTSPEGFRPVPPRANASSSAGTACGLSGSLRVGLCPQGRGPVRMGGTERVHSGNLAAYAALASGRFAPP